MAHVGVPEHTPETERALCRNLGITKENIPVLKEVLNKALTAWEKGDTKEGIAKDATNQIGVVTGLGLLGYPLEAPAKLLYPVLTPLRNRLARSVYGGNALNYRRITGINTTNLWGSVAEATDSTTGRNSRIKYNEKDVSLSFKSVEMETMITPEAIFGSSSRITPGQDFNAREFASLSLLQSLMLAEEWLLLGGNVTALGDVTGITKTGITQAATGVGSLTNATTYYFSVGALTLQGLLQGAKGNGGTDAAGEGKSAEQSIATTSGGSAGDKSVTFTWNAVKGAVAYNVYIGSTTGVANHKYFSTVYTNYAYVDSVPSTNRPNIADQTGNSLDFDGIIPQAFATGAGYYKAIAIAAAGPQPWTSDSAAGVAEFDAAFKSFYDNYRLSPTEIFVGSGDKKGVDKIIAASSNPVYRIDVAAGDLNITGSIGVKSMANRYMNTDVAVTVHPFLPSSGTSLLVGMNLGPYYPNANIAQALEVALGWDYRQIEFALAKRALEIGMDMRGALVVRAPFVLGAIHGQQNT